ncbi:hypothetical protein DFJ43DRAFT_1095613 [Lentinula guzmanii]|uniref:Alpha/beta hydrolase fold-3 domain-containing protein n=1 Tax=Lentinula guzmanii TaxID=2804957 RepID=A0AA38JBP0_9AGAR|nr:hypothetical protein DFJ43DRAFT_1095613 [Lentinula guzmanii]
MSLKNRYSTPPRLDESKFGVLSLPQYVWMKVKLMVIPRTLPLKRIIGDSAFRFLADYFPEPELQQVLGTSVSVYSTWARKENLPITIEELEDGGGGAYIFAVQIFTISFWRFIQLQLEKRGLKVGIAIMSYSLVPVSQFPTPLWQTSRALQHLLSVEKVKPSNLVLVGDSAGGNLVSQVLSSMLHPLFDPPIIPNGTRLRGAYMMSPWISLTGVYTGEDSTNTQLLPSFTENNHCDVVGRDALLSWGKTVLEGAPNPTTTDYPYLEPINAPITARRRVHNDPFFDFQVADGPLGGKRQSLTPKILEWVWKCFEEK